MDFKKMLIILKDTFIERFHYAADLEYHLLRNNYEYYRRIKSRKHVNEFIDECINKYSSPTWNTEKTNTYKLQKKLATYQKLNKLYVHGSDIIIKYFNKSDFNQKDKKELLDEFYGVRYENINSNNYEISDDLEFLIDKTIITYEALDDISKEIKSIKEDTINVFDINITPDSDFLYQECLKQAKRFASTDDGKIKAKIIGSVLYATGLLDDTLSQVDRTKNLSQLIGEPLTSSKHTIYPSYYREGFDKPEGVLTNLIIIKYFFKRIKFYKALEIIEDEISDIKEIIQTEKLKEKKGRQDKIDEILNSTKNSK